MSAVAEMMNALKPFLGRCRSITEAFQEKQGKWDMGAQIAHVHSEVSEVFQALRHGYPPYEVQMEIADSVLSSITMAHVFGMSDDDILTALEAALEKCERRAYS